MRILFCGDIMPGGILHYQDKFLSDEIRRYMGIFDLRVATFECSVGSNIPFDKGKMERGDGKNIVYALDNDIKKINELKIDVVTIANNHIFDQGEEGLLNTISHLDRMGIRHCGAGRNIQEAREPAVVMIKGKSIAFIGCSFVNTYPIVVEAATTSSAGIYQTTLSDLEESVRRCKQLYDFVFVLPHWGREYDYLPIPQYKHWAQCLIDSGADGVIGSHPHQIQPHYKYHQKYIYYSLGNFLFPDICMQVPRPMFYPERKEDIARLKKVWAYPDNLKEPVLAIWPGRSRIGMVSEIVIQESGRMTSKTKLTCMTKDNVLCFYNCKNTSLKKLRLFLFAVVIKMKHYPFYYRLYFSRYNLLRRIIHRVSDVLNIKYDVDVTID